MISYSLFFFQHIFTVIFQKYHEIKVRFLTCIRHLSSPCVPIPVNDSCGSFFNQFCSHFSPSKLSSG